MPDIAFDLLNCALNDLPALAAQTDGRALDDLSKDLDGIAMKAAFAAAYLGWRAGPCGSDQGHEAALKRANQVHNKVRRALGYHVKVKLSIPDCEVNHA